MARDISESLKQDIQPLLISYFSDEKLHDEAFTTQQIESGEILYEPEQILPYLQTVFFEEHLLELQLDQSTRVFFSNIVDDAPDNNSEADGDNSQIIDYESGAYLKGCDSFVLSPLSPGIGNARIRTCKQVVVRFYMGTTAVELGCTFRDQDMLKGVPVLRFNFPVVGRINRNYRAFRVKVVSGVDAQLRLLKSKSGDIGESFFQIADVSAMGLAFQLSTSKPPFEVGETISFAVHVPGIDNLELTGVVRHISDVRDSKGKKIICGLQFDLETRSLAAQIERLTATIQRLQLREIAERTAFLKGVRIMK